MILRLWASEPPYEIDGKFWTIRLKKTVDEETGIGYIPKPLQQPHPPIAMPAMSRNSPSMKFAGRRGYQPFGHCLITGNVLADHWTDLREGGPRSRPSTEPRRLEGRALDLPGRQHRRGRKQEPVRIRLARTYQYIGRLFDKGLGRKIYKRDLAMSDADCNIDFLMGEQIIAGNVDEVLRRLLPPDRRNRSLRHADPDGLRLGRQTELAPQHGAVCPRADAGAKQGGLFVTVSGRSAVCCRRFPGWTLFFRRIRSSTSCTRRCSRRCKGSCNRSCGRSTPRAWNVILPKAASGRSPKMRSRSTQGAGRHDHETRAWSKTPRLHGTAGPGGRQSPRRAGCRRAGAA